MHSMPKYLKIPLYILYPFPFPLFNPQKDHLNTHIKKKEIELKFFNWRCKDKTELEMVKEGHFNAVINEFQETRVRKDTNVLRFYFKSWLNFFRKQSRESSGRHSQVRNMNFSGRLSNMKRGSLRGSKLQRLTMGISTLQIKESSTEEDTEPDVDFLKRFSEIRNQGAERAEGRLVLYMCVCGCLRVY